jgi:hypothetical protein
MSKYINNVDDELKFTDYAKFIIVISGFERNTEEKIYSQEIHYLNSLDDDEIDSLKKKIKIDIYGYSVYQSFDSYDEFEKIEHKVLDNFSQHNDFGCDSHWLSYEVFEFIPDTEVYHEGLTSGIRFLDTHHFEPFLQSIDIDAFPIALRYIDCPMFVCIEKPDLFPKDKFKWF